MNLPYLLETRDSEGRFTLGEGWLQGRTAYGGASSAVALTAIKAACPDLPPLRSAQIAFVGPLSGSVEAQPTLLRRGKNSAFVGCDVIGADGLGLKALFLFMASRASAIDHLDLPVPAIEPPGTRMITEGLAPGFLDNFELSGWVRGGGRIARWCRLRERDGLPPEVELVAIADALPPAAMSLIDGWGPISTTTWQLNLVTDDIATRDGWWLLEATTLHAGNGSSSQSMTIWNRDGRAIATATQSVALFI